MNTHVYQDDSRLRLGPAADHGRDPRADQRVDAGRSGIGRAEPGQVHLAHLRVSQDATVPGSAGPGIGRPRALHRFRVGLITAAAILTAAVAGLAFWVSFEAISAYVVRIGALPPNLRYAGPLLVDSFTVLATVFLLWLALAGTPLRKVWDAYYAWSLIIVATAASAYLNAAHVAADAPDVARWVAGAVPVTLLGAVHLLVLLLLRLLAGSPTARPAWDPIPPPPPDPKPDPPPDQDDPVPVLVPEARPRVAQDVSRPRPAARGRPTAEVTQRAAQGHSAAQIARDLGLSDRARRTWVGDLVREYRDQPVQVSPNGHGPGGGS